MWLVASFLVTSNLETYKVLAALINLHSYEDLTSFGRIQLMLKVHQYILRNECCQCDLYLHMLYSDISLVAVQPFGSFLNLDIT